MSKKEVVTAEVVRELSDIKLRKEPTQFRVLYPPTPNSDDSSTSFRFIPTQPETKIEAELRAYKFRDENYLVNIKATTGYKYLNLIGKNDNVRFCVKRTINKENRTIHEVFYLKDYKTFKEAMDAALCFIADMLDMNPPLVPVYDYALGEAKLAGYKTRKGDPVLTSEKHKVDDDITDPKTGEIGRVDAITSLTTVVAIFGTGESTRVIHNEILYANMQDTRLDKIEKIQKELEKDTLSSIDRRSLEIDLETLTSQVNTYFKIVSNNANVPTTAASMRKSNSRRRKVPALITKANLSAIGHRPNSI